jgi:hypothetical protein
VIWPFERVVGTYLSRSRERFLNALHIIGYSMPHDDVEVRALLRAGISRGSSSPKVYVQNPAPDVHDRIRNYLARSIGSNYVPFPGYH